jgi:hypothetical protein
MANGFWHDGGKLADAKITRILLPPIEVQNYPYFYVTFCGTLISIELKVTNLSAESLTDSTAAAYSPERRWGRALNFLYFYR